MGFNRANPPRAAFRFSIPKIRFPPHLTSATGVPRRAEVPDFEPADWLGDKDLDRVPRVVPLALAAAHEALHHAGLGAMNAEQRRETGVLLGSGGGGFSFAEPQFVIVFADTQKVCRPTPFPAQFPHGFLEISIAHGLRERRHHFRWLHFVERRARLRID
jgi:3-oxoacyl-[acyl-carrier-protein] synthase II